MSSLIITISREYGSGGGLIGEKLAEALGISCYDKLLLQLAAAKSGLSPEFVERSEEQVTSSFLYNLSMISQSTTNFFYGYDVPLGDKVFFAQTAVIKELAERESCVIVGRCSDYILRSRENCLKVFIYAPKEDRVVRLMERYGVSEKEAKDKIHKFDRARANYYKNYTGEPWGSVKAHDLCINTAISGIEGAVKIIRSMVDVMK